MLVATILLTVILLMFVIYQDLYSRTIHIFLPIGIFILGLVYNYCINSLISSTLLLNLSFILINVLGLVAYFSLKNKYLINPFKDLIGVGDVVFFIAITPFFKINMFILFFIGSIFLSLMLHMIIKRFNNQNTIPLAGYMSIPLSLLLIARDFHNLFFF